MVELMEKYLSEACSAYDLADMKVTAFMNAATRTLDIHRHDAMLKVMTESGTDDDLDYLYEEAEKSFIESAQMAVKKIQESIAKFFADLRDKIINMLTEKDIKNNLEKIQKKLKLMPLLARKKVVIEDMEGQDKVTNEAIAQVAKLAAKKTAGQEVTTEDVAEVEKNFLEKHGKAIGVGAAVTVTVDALVTLLLAKVSKLGAETRSHEADTKNAVANFAKNLKAGMDASSARVWTSICALRSKIGRQAGEDKFRSITNAISRLKAAIGGLGKKGKAEEAKQEGVDDTIVSTDPIDAVATDNGWDAILNNLDTMVPDEGCKTEGTETDTDAFDTLFQEFFGGDCSSKECSSTVWDGYSPKKPSNEQIVSDLYKDVMAEVKGKNPAPAPTTEGATTFESLMQEIDDLF